MRNQLKLFVFLCLCVFAGVCLYAQTPGSEQVGSPSAGISTGTSEIDSSVSSIVPKAAALEASFNQLPEKISELVASQTLNQEIVNLKTRLNDQKTRLNELKVSKMYSFDKISLIRGPIKENQAALIKLQDRIAQRIKSIEALRQNWESQKTVWSSLKENHAFDSQAVKTIFKEAEKRFVKASKMLEGIESPLVGIQQKAIELGTEYQNLLKEIDEILVTMRKDMFRKSRPAMFTPTFIRQFDKSIWEDFWVGIASLSLPAQGFYSTQGWIILLQIFGIIFFIWLFSSFDAEKAKAIKLDFLITRKYSAAVIAGIAIFYPLFEDLPNMVRVLLWSIMTVGGARLVAGVVETPWRRKLIYLLAGLFLTSQLFYLINLPSPIFRIYVALVGLAGALICFWRVRINKMQNASLLVMAIAKAGGLTLLVVFITQVAGYVSLANHLLEVAIKSVFFILFVWIADLILRGASEALFDNVYVKKSRIFQKHSTHIVNRVKMLVDILAVFFGLSGLLAVWGVHHSTTEAAVGIMNLGIALQGERLTIGIIVTAITLLYASLFTSWLIQRVLDEEVYPRKKVESGVGISINRLIHYAFVIFGTVIALSTIGIGLQSLTVLMGAFGIGIGFGLQNIVNNFASGLILLFERSIKVGDVVQIGPTWGKIKNLGLRATVVETFDRSELIVPNSDLVSTNVTNWTLSDRQIRVIVRVGVAYGSDVELVTSLLQRAAQENPIVMKFPEPSVLFMGFGNSSLDFELRVFVSDIDNMLVIRNQLNREIDHLFRENDVEIPFPQNDVHIRTMDEPFKNSILQITGKDSKPDKKEES
ncbi:MAG: hypothetical protein PWR01_2405 [Clostridiales bacterium]|nr:hypothetical protein [Clostridiales bacterium]MDN5281332.1 hypothetical protein [Candidatus Ozemobacter sp.]